MNKDIKELSREFQDELGKLKDAIKEMDTDLGLLQNEDGICWSGKNAYSIVESCMIEVEHNRNLVDQLTKCLDYMKSLGK